MHMIILQIRMIHIEDGTMAEDGYEELGNVLNASGCKALTFHSCDLNKKKLMALRKQCQKEKVQVLHFKR